jgi:hypothetical protein
VAALTSVAIRLCVNKSKLEVEVEGWRGSNPSFDAVIILADRVGCPLSSNIHLISGLRLQSPNLSFSSLQSPVFIPLLSIPMEAFCIKCKTKREMQDPQLLFNARFALHQRGLDLRHCNDALGQDRFTRDG